MAKKPRKQVHLPPAVCTQEFKDELQNYASEIDRSMSWVIVKALEEYMNNHPVTQSAEPVTMRQAPYR